MKTKGAVLLSGAMIAVLLVSRYFALSRSGLSLGWMVYLGVPLTAAGVLLVLRLVRLGTGLGAKPMLPQAPPPPAWPQSVSRLVVQRLQELENLRASGAISEPEYAARRLRIVSSI